MTSVFKFSFFFFRIKYLRGVLPILIFILSNSILQRIGFWGFLSILFLLLLLLLTRLPFHLCYYKQEQCSIIEWVKPQHKKKDFSAALTRDFSSTLEYFPRDTLNAIVGSVHSLLPSLPSLPPGYKVGTLSQLKAHWAQVILGSWTLRGSKSLQSLLADSFCICTATTTTNMNEC